MRRKNKELEIYDMKEKSKLSRKERTQFLIEVFVKKGSYPSNMDIGNKFTTGPKFTKGSELVIKGRPKNEVHVIPLTEQGWKDLRKLCRKAIKELHDEKGKKHN